MSDWNYNVKNAPRWRKVWLSIESSSGKTFVALDQAWNRADRVYAWKENEIPKPAPLESKYE